MSKRPTITSRDLDAPFTLSEKAEERLRRWPRAGVRTWRNPLNTRITKFYVTLWDRPGVQHVGLLAADPWFDTQEEAIDHARLVIGAHRRNGVTLSGEPNPDYLR